MSWQKEQFLELKARVHQIDQAIYDLLSALETYRNAETATTLRLEEITGNYETALALKLLYEREAEDGRIRGRNAGIRAEQEKAVIDDLHRNDPQISTLYKRYQTVKIEAENITTQIKIAGEQLYALRKTAAMYAGLGFALQACWQPPENITVDTHTHFGRIAYAPRPKAPKKTHT